MRNREFCRKRKPWSNNQGFVISSSYLYYGYVGCLQAFRALFNFKLNLLTFFKCFVSIAVDSFVMDKYVITSFSRDEPITFRTVEPLDRSFFHGKVPHKKYICCVQLCFRTVPGKKKIASNDDMTPFPAISILLLLY